ncbi:MAG: hypothetical protein ACLRI7_10255 [Ruthenibacterium lactatiformans]
MSWKRRRRCRMRAAGWLKTLRFPGGDGETVRFRGNRARGMLLTCRSALVEDCLFEVPGAAVSGGRGGIPA